VKTFQPAGFAGVNPALVHKEQELDRSAYDRYIARFNAEDETAFDDYIHSEMKMLNGALEFSGREGMKQHYGERIWPIFKEELNILRFVSDGQTLAVRMWTHFIARKDAEETIFGPVTKGHTFDFRGVVFYEIKDGLFSNIVVSYNSFTSTPPGGATIELGLPH
jgi:hypothetical protein